MSANGASEPAAPAEAVRLRPSFDHHRLQAELTKVTRRPWGKQRIYDAVGVGTATELDWRVLPLRSAGGDPDRTDPGGPGSHDFAPTPWLDRLPYLAGILAEIPAPLNAVRLMALGPGAVSAEHSDPKYSLGHGFVRLHIPVITNPDALLILDGVPHRWQPGEFWFGEFSRPHQVRNHGAETRIHMVIDALMTTDLVELFPAEWRPGLLGGDVLFNRHSVPVVSSSRPRPSCSVEVPRTFIDFDDYTSDLAARTVVVQVTDTEDPMRLFDAEGQPFALIHVGDEEFRFAGWSEQRTIQLRPDAAVLRTRAGGTVRALTVPIGAATRC